MGDKSTIEWTDATWNPVTGCSKVSPGCAHCYAESYTGRMAGQPGWIEEHRPWTPANAAHNIRLHPERLEQPLRWRRPRMVFVNSMSDLFHEQVPDEFIAQVFEQMALAGHHTFQVLTKRPERMRDLLDWGPFRKATGVSDWPIPNVWLGTSIENRRYVYRADYLRETLAIVRFISAEPLLGPLLHDGGDLTWRDGQVVGTSPRWNDDYDGPELDLSGIDWLIVGGESGPKHRPMSAEWVRALRDYCYHSRHLYDPFRGQRGPGTAFFFKQWGGRTPKAGGRELDGRTWGEMPTAPEALAA